MTNDPDELLRTRDVARHFSVTTYTVREWIRDGKIESVLVNGQHRIRRREVNKMEQRRYG
jgi:excisionase family DNA binding protein